MTNQYKIECIKHQLLDTNKEFKLIVINLICSLEELKSRIISRGREEDSDKLNNWDKYAKSKESLVYVNTNFTSNNDVFKLSEDEVFDFLSSLV